MRVAIIVMGLCLLASPALSLEPTQVPIAALNIDASAPWARGVTPAKREKAKAEFDEALRLVQSARYGAAVDAYQRALVHWDHPAIHLALAQTLMRLDLATDALLHLWMSMRYGADALGPRHVEEVVRDATVLVETRVAHLVVRSNEAGVTVKVGTTVVLDGPGTWQGVVRPATLEVVAQRVGTKPVVVLARTFEAGLRSEVTIRGKAGGALSADVGERRASAAELRDLQRQLVGFEVEIPGADVAKPVVVAPTSVPLPPRIAKICASARGDTAVVCGEYETLHAQVERDRAAARRRLDEQTRGGVVELLR